MFLWIYDLPNWLLFTLFTVLALALTWGSVLLLRRTTGRVFGDETTESRNGLLELVLTGTGIFYGLLLGLIAAATYTNYSAAGDTVNAEANSVAMLYRDITGYPEPLRSELRDDLKNYVRYVIDDAWPAQQRGEPSPQGVPLATAMLNRLTPFNPATTGQQVIHAETFKQFNSFIELRRQRINAAEDSLPGPLWAVLILGAVINIVLISMLAIRKLAAHLLISGLFAIFVAMMIFLIAAMDNPFLGEFSVTPAAFELLQDNLIGK